MAVIELSACIYYITDIVYCRSKPPQLHDERVLFLLQNYLASMSRKANLLGKLLYCINF